MASLDGEIGLFVRVGSDEYNRLAFADENYRRPVVGTSCRDIIYLRWTLARPR